MTQIEAEARERWIPFEIRDERLGVADKLAAAAALTATLLIFVPFPFVLVVDLVSSVAPVSERALWTIVLLAVPVLGVLLYLGLRRQVGRSTLRWIVVAIVLAAVAGGLLGLRPEIATSIQTVAPGR